MNRALDIMEKPRERGVRPPVPPMVYVYGSTTWEYKRLSRELSQEGLPTEEEMNALGAEGWELAAMVSQSDKVYFYLKRPRNRGLDDLPRGVGRRRKVLRSDGPDERMSAKVLPLLWHFELPPPLPGSLRRRPS